MQIYLVGGAVRDALLGRKVKEHDYVVVGATIEQMLNLGYTQVGKDFPVFLHPKTKDEYALARTERKQGAGYTGFICDFSPDITLEDDLIRRDLTVNALAQDLDTQQIIDPFNGQADLEKRILRHVSPAFSEDPLRVLRVARFAARYHHLGFSIAPETLTLMQQISHSGELQALTKERVWLEFEKALSDGYLEVFIDVLVQADALKELSPALHALWQAQQEKIKERIACARKADLSPQQVIALLLCDLVSPEREAFYHAYRVPNAYVEHCEHLASHHEVLSNDTQNADDLLALFNAIDLWRKPQHLDALLGSFNCYSVSDFTQRQRIQEAATQARAVNAQTFIAQGIKGAAIKEAMAEGRIQAIASSL